METCFPSQWSCLFEKSWSNGCVWVSVWKLWYYSFVLIKEDYIMMVLHCVCRTLFSVCFWMQIWMDMMVVSTLCILIQVASCWSQDQMTAKLCFGIGLHKYKSSHTILVMITMFSRPKSCHFQMTTVLSAVLLMVRFVKFVFWSPQKKFESIYRPNLCA